MFFLFQGCILRFHVDLPGWIGSKFLEIVPACWLALRNGRIFPTKSASKRRLFIWPPGLEKWLSASLPLKKEKALHPRKPTWIPKMMVWKRWSPLNMAIFGIYVRFLGGKKKGTKKKWARWIQHTTPPRSRGLRTCFRHLSHACCRRASRGRRVGGIEKNRISGDIKQT